jgi:hypothetical protein
MVAPILRIDEGLKQFATQRQIEFIDAINRLHSMRAAALELGINNGVISESITRLKKRAALCGYSPEHHLTHPVAPGQRLRGASQLYRKGEPEPLLTWVKSSAYDEAREAIIREAIKALSSDIAGLAPITKRPERVSDELLCIIPVGDPHFGLYVWAKECGAAFDTDIARRLSIAASDRLIDSSPACSVGILLLLGDITHADDQSNQTPAHKHQLDVDSRFVRVIGIAIETYRHIIFRMLEKYDRVIAKLLPGNHDPHAVWALSYALHAYFSNEPRVEVDLGPSKFWYYQFGKVLIGSTHGDTVKHERLPGIMAADRPVEWGAATARYWYTGHVHSSNVKEFPGVMCESFRTLAAADAYTSGHGYRSGRDMVAIIHHRDHGEVERHRVDVGMLE